MKFSIPILLILVTVLVCGVLVPAPSGAQKKDPGVTIKQDGDSILLIPNDPKRAYLVIGYPRDKDGKKPAGANPLPYLVGEQKISAKEYSKIAIWEVRNATEVKILPDANGWRIDEEPCFCDKPLPPPPPLAFLISAAGLKGQS
jgi:hypothetical protein